MRDEMDSRLNLEPMENRIPDEKLSMGSINDKYPVRLSDGKTVIFITDKRKEPEIRLKYESLKDKKYPTRSPRHYR